MLPRHVNTLEEVYATQRKLKHQMKATRHELVRSTSGTGEHLKDFLLKRVLLPASVAGLAGWVLKRFLSKSQPARHNGMRAAAPPAPPALAGVLVSLVPIVVPLVLQYFERKKAEREQEQEAVNM